MANRLSADTSKKVLLVERGPRADTWASRVPLLSVDFRSDGTRSMKQMSEFQPVLGKSVELVTGRVLGGTSRINQMAYIRGLPAEYDAWAAAGRRGWAWKDMQPYFLKSEQAVGYDEPLEGNHSVNGRAFLPSNTFRTFAKPLGARRVEE